MSSTLTLLHKAGFRFAFDPDSCKECPGNCCRGVSGYVWVTDTEIRNLANFLKMNTIDFRQRYVRKIDNRYSLKESWTGTDYPCIFFDAEARGCSVYQARPKQCRTYPFWEENRGLTGDLTHDCPGIRNSSDFSGDKAQHHR